MLLVKVGNGRHAFENIVFVLGFDMFPKTAILAVFTQNEVQKTSSVNKAVRRTLLISSPLLEQSLRQPG
jgi:hypothetical protein